MEPNKVPVEYCHRWIVAGLRIGERHYTLFVICSLIMYISLFILSVIPFIGFVASLVLLFFYWLAAMRLTHNLLKEPTLKTDLDTYLKYAFDKDYIERFKTPLIILGALGVISVATVYTRISGLILLGTVASYLATYLFSFTAFMMLQTPGMTWDQALNKVYQGFTLNLGAWLAAILILMAFAVASLLLCFAPFLLYFAPMTFSVGYLIYASIFESLDTEAVITEWSSKTVIETHILPPES